jgi:3'-5' exoribonuclease
MAEKLTTTARRPRVAELQKGKRVEGGIYLVEASNFKQTRNQKHFIQMTLRDRTGSIKAIRWEASEDLYASFGVDDFVQIQGRVEEFQQQLQVIVDSLAKVDPSTVDFNDFLPTSSEDLAALEAELRRSVSGVQEPHIKALLEIVLRDPETLAGLTRCPAGKTLHHAYVGGLLEHVVALVRSASAVCQLYPQLNRDVLTAAALLHDIGKIEELSYTRTFGYTARGQLLGHISLGLLLVQGWVSRIPGFPERLLLEILHIIASHHGEAEYGAIKPPMTPEAIAFHYLDNLDAKLASLSAIEKEVEAQDPGFNSDELGRWSDFKPHLGKKFFFPRRRAET